MATNLPHDPGKSNEQELHGERAGAIGDGNAAVDASERAGVESLATTGIHQPSVNINMANLDNGVVEPPLAAQPPIAPGALAEPPVAVQPPIAPEALAEPPVKPTTSDRTGAEALVETSGKDEFDTRGDDDGLPGGRGDDSANDGNSRDAIVFGDNIGSDIIRGFSIGDGDQIDLSGTGFSDFEALMANATQVGPDTVFQMEGGSFTLQGVRVDDLTAEQFLMADSVPQNGITGENVMALDLTSLIPDGADASTYEVVVSGLPVGASLSSGDEDPDRSWTMTLAQVVGLTIAVPTAASATEELAELSIDVIDRSTNEVVQTATFDPNSFDEASNTISLNSISLAPQSSPAQDQPAVTTGGTDGGGDGGADINVGATDSSQLSTTELTGVPPASGHNGGEDTNVAAATDEAVAAAEPVVEEPAPAEEEAAPETPVEPAVTGGSGDGQPDNPVEEPAPVINAAPTDLTLDTNSVAENAANGTVVGTASATDPDSGETFSYSLTNDAGGRFAIDSSTGAITVADGTLLNFEAANSHNVTVRVTDSGGNTYDEVMSLDLTNVNETPTDLTLDTNSVAEYAANGTVVGTASATDPDAGETFSYSLTNDAGGRFAIDSSTGAITVADGTLLDFEAANSHNVTVRVTDSAGNTYDEVMSLDLTDVNEAPTDLTLSADTTIENPVNGAVVGTATPTDPDSGETFSYSLTNDAGGRFMINGETGEVMILDGSLFDIGDASSHDITIQVTDSGGLTYDEVLTINVTNATGNDDIEGTAGSDDLTGSSASETFNLGAGDDEIDAKSGDDIVLGGAGDDEIDGGAGADILMGGTGSDEIDGGSGNDILDGGAGADQLDGEGGTDTATYITSSSGVNVNFATGVGTGGDAEGDTLSNIENLTGSLNNDTLTGDNGNNVLTGLAGDDVITGGDGSDTFVFGAGGGSDIVIGGAGGGWTDTILLQDTDGSAVDAGWTLTLTTGTQINDDGSTITLSDDSAGTITLADGSEIAFDGIENIAY